MHTFLFYHHEDIFVNVEEQKQFIEQLASLIYNFYVLYPFGMGLHLYSSPQSHTLGVRLVNMQVN